MTSKFVYMFGSQLITKTEQIPWLAMVGCEVGSSLSGYIMLG